MKAWFPIKSDRFRYMDWHKGLYDQYSGPIISGSKSASVSGGFGHLQFQGIVRPEFSLWLNDYNIEEDLITRTSFNYRSLEFRLLLRGEVEHRSRPHRWSLIKEYDMNLSHSQPLDSDVRFKKGVPCRSVDIHFGPEMVERLAGQMPELVYPFLNEYHADRRISLFKKDVRPNGAILDALRSLIPMAAGGGLPPLLLDNRAEVLLAQILLWKGELEQRRGLTDQQKQVLSHLNYIKKVLAVEEESFQGITRYSQMVNMSPTKFKTAFKRELGVTPFEYWQQGQLQKGVYRLLTTNDKVKEIALDIGFSDAQAFNKAFRKMFEETPTAYRRRVSQFDINDI